MENKFEFKDLMNNILSGFLWETSIVMIVYLVNPEIIKTIDWGIVKDFNVILFTLLIVFAFILGIILRGFEKPLTSIYKHLFGDAYYLAIKPEIEGKDKNIGVFYSIPQFRVNLGRLDRNIYKVIEDKMLKIGIISKTTVNDSKEDLIDNFPNTSSKKEKCHLRNIGIMAERYLMIKKIEGPYIRFKDIKNFFESVSFPLFFSLILAKWALFSSFSCFFYFLGVVIIFVIFILRYDYYFRNYVKDVFRLIFFAEV